MTKPYFTLVVRDGSFWSPQFGDYCRATVQEELLDMKHANLGLNRGDGTYYRAADFKIIRTNDDQASLDTAVAALNAS